VENQFAKGFKGLKLIGGGVNFRNINWNLCKEHGNIHHCIMVYTPLLDGGI
jgi:hypothetical protein